MGFTKIEVVIDRLFEFLWTVEVSVLFARCFE